MFFIRSRRQGKIKGDFSKTFLEFTDNDPNHSSEQAWQSGVRMISVPHSCRCCNCYLNNCLLLLFIFMYYLSHLLHVQKAFLLKSKPAS